MKNEFHHLALTASLAALLMLGGCGSDSDTDSGQPDGASVDGDSDTVQDPAPPEPSIPGVDNDPRSRADPDRLDNAEALLPPQC